MKTASESREAATESLERVQRDGIRAKPRLLISLLGGAAFGLVAALIPAIREEWILIPMLAWSGFGAVWLLSIYVSVRGADFKRTRHLSEREDDGRATARGILIAGGLVSLFAVAFSLFRAHDLGQAKSPMEYVVTLMGMATVAVTWLMIQVSSMLHYAHLYYDGDDGGVNFHTEYGEDDGPTYRDFAYLSFTVGMTFQTSDPEVSDSRIRNAILHHALLSYVFATLLVALLINGISSLVG